MKEVVPNFVPSLTCVTDFPPPFRSPLPHSYHFTRPGKFKSITSLKTSENAHPLSQITVWEGKDSDLPNYENFDERLFQVAQLFVGNTKIQVETPQLQFTSSDTKEERTLRICKLIGLLLAHTTEGADVTAVTLYLDTKSKPPVFEFVFAKNKEPASPHDLERAKKLAQVIRDNASKSCQTFVTIICEYMATYCSHNQRHLAKHIRDLTPPLITHLE